MAPELDCVVEGVKMLMVEDVLRDREQSLLMAMGRENWNSHIRKVFDKADVVADSKVQD